MGGLGSGLYSRVKKSGKRIVESSLSLDIRWLKRKGLLIPGLNITLSWSRGDTIITNIETTVYDNYLLLIYTFKKTKNIEQKIYFTYTPCNYGGTRIWFQCPSCNRRCALIYIQEKYFACRICCGLTYRTCNETPIYRRFSKANKLRKRLGAQAGALNSFPSIKPKGMHKTTWLMIRIEILNIERKGLAELYRMLGVDRCTIS
jgi:hypothetical protein